jgi:hypothetical protein
MYHRRPKFNLVYCSLYRAEPWNSEIAGQPEVQIIRHRVLEMGHLKDPMSVLEQESERMSDMLVQY